MQHMLEREKGHKCVKVQWSDLYIANRTTTTDYPSQPRVYVLGTDRGCYGVMLHVFHAPNLVEYVPRVLRMLPETSLANQLGSHKCDIHMIDV
jgi:hypothetical protein